MVDADGTDEERLTTNGSYDSEPAYSAGGGKIGFSSDRGGGHDLSMSWMQMGPT